MNICDAHAAAYAGKCPFCALSAQQHANVRTLDARIADLSLVTRDLRLECADLRRQINALLQVVVDLQRAHNALAGLPYQECAGRPYRVPE